MSNSETAATASIFEHPDGGYGWIIIIACTVINSSLPPLMQCFGIIFKNQFNEMGITAAEISFLLHLNNSVMCSLGLLSGPILKKYNYRQTSLCGCFLVCSGIILTSFTTTYGQLIIPICILIGAGQSILMPSTALAINTYFKQRLTLAMSVTITGVAIFPIVVPHICNYLLNLYGVAGTVLLFGAISLHSFAGALLLRPARIKKKSSNYNRKQQLQCLLPTVVENKKINKFDKLLAMFDVELFKERSYVIIIIGMGISYVAELNFLLMAPFILSELAKFTTTEIALAMSILAAADICGRSLLPVISHKTGSSPKVMYAFTLGGFTIGRTVMASFCDIKYIVLASCVVIGLSKGAKAVYQSLILPKYVSLEKLPSAMGFLMVLNGVLSLLIGPLISAVHDLTNSYTYTLHVASCISVFCILLWILDYCELNFRPKRDIAEVESNNVV